jgi:hypothetical protein
MGKKSAPKEAPAIARTITRHALLLLFLAVFFLSMLSGPALTWTSLGFGLLKGLLAVALGWVFFLIVFDAVIRSITASAIDARATRREGGLLYHFLPPDPGELLDEEAAPPPKKTPKKAAKRS